MIVTGASANFRLEILYFFCILQKIITSQHHNMSKYQQEWKKAIQKNIKLKWKVKTSGGDIMIRVPAETDMEKLESNFPDLMAPIKPTILSPQTRLTMYVGNSDQADFKFIVS